MDLRAGNCGIIVIPNQLGFDLSFDKNLLAFVLSRTGILVSTFYKIFWRISHYVYLSHRNCTIQIKNLN